MQGLTSAQSVAASTALRARWPLPARLTGISASVATSDALRLCARLMYARKPPTSAIPGTHHPPTSACLTSLSTVCTAIQQAYTGWICTVSHDLDSEQSRQTRTCSPPLLGSKCKDQPHLLNEQPIGNPKKQPGTHVRSAGDLQPVHPPRCWADPSDAQWSPRCRWRSRPHCRCQCPARCSHRRHL